MRPNAFSLLIAISTLNPIKTPLAILFLTLFGACKKGPEDIGPCGGEGPHRRIALAEGGD
jgi:hypothetical protein